MSERSWETSAVVIEFSVNPALSLVNWYIRQKLQ